MKRLLVIVATLVLVATSCSSGEESASPGLTKVRLMLDWTPNTNHSGIYLAQRNGWYAERGLDVEILQPGEQGGLAALGTGDVDFAVSFQEEIIPARAEGVPAVSVAGMMSTNTSSIVSLANDNVTRPRDFEGKTYGGYGAPLETALIKNLVQCDGGDPSKVNFVDIGDLDTRVGMEQDRFDLAWIFNGWDAIRMRQQNVAINTVSFSDHFDCIPDWYTPLLATSEDKLDNDSDMVRKFVEATAQGYQQSIADPNGASDALLAAAPELDAALVRESSTYLAQYYAKPGQPWGVHDRNVWTRFNDYLRNSGGVTEPVDVNSSFTNDFVSS